MVKHVYFGIENLELNTTQRNTLVAALQALGSNNESVQPAERNHWRIRLDNEAAIFEALFDEDNISIGAMKQFLANIFSVDVSTIDNSTQQTAIGLLVTFSRLGTDYFRTIAFGYDSEWPAWEVSRKAAVAYLRVNMLEWDGSN